MLESRLGVGWKFHHRRLKLRFGVDVNALLKTSLFASSTSQPPALHTRAGYSDSTRADSCRCMTALEA
ncbi:hypothetical protein Pyn_32913 [Prunus yedoensis var. nudiflora]|uniref:Uncharacterized protein n=1 Tax=Prunus yedoensis var. nudiflora TaxID=2094558 RepID=A0A314Z321_PRUYE|nr:hypothetical protein Pyn_32913 [Prunus yedoensis var. nudiflora]